MKPCWKNRKLLAWLAADALDPASARALRAHLETCPGCRAYLQELAEIAGRLATNALTSDVTVAAAFHQKLLARLRTETSASVSDRLRRGIRPLCIDWRIAVPALGIAIIIVTGLLLLWRGPHASPSRPSAPILAARPGSALPPTLAIYQVAANRSLEQFDQLIMREGDRRLPPAPLYTASGLARYAASD